MNILGRLTHHFGTIGLYFRIVGEVGRMLFSAKASFARWLGPSNSNIMASNEIPDSPEPLISLATDAADGADAEGASIGLSQNTAVKSRADLVAFAGDPDAVPPIIGAQNAHNAAKAAKVNATATRRTGESNGRAFCASAVGMLKNHLSTQWSSQWQAAGFTTGSLAIPDDPLSPLSEVRAYFLANPAHENAPLGLTALLCTTRIAEVTAVRAASNQSNKDLGDAKAASDVAKKALYKRMTGLRAELAQLLAADDPRWYAMGFDRPADGWQPGPVEHLVLTPGGPGMVFADWDDARRAARYRVFKQASGTDPAPVEVTSTVTVSELTLTGLTSGSTVEITVTAVNEAGDSAVSAKGAIVVP